MTPELLTAGSGKKVWWLCGLGHSWQAAVYARTKEGVSCVGCSGRWTAASLSLFVASIKDHLETLTPAELYAICQQNGLLASSKQEFAKRLATGRLRADDLEALLESVQGEHGKAPEEEDEIVESGEILGSSTNAHLAAHVDTVDLPSQIHDLPEVVVAQALAAASVLLANADEETADFLVASSAAKLWRQAYRDPAAVERTTAVTFTDEFKERVRRAFRDEYDASIMLQTPAGWSFEAGGVPTQPNLMQRHVAVQVRDKLRVGNWSGTGAGKTISAVLASRVVDSSLTVVVCPNNTIGGWCKTITGCFPDTIVATKSFEPDWGHVEGPRYLILNYESFQAPDTDERLSALVEREPIGMIVIDEVHYAKQRTPGNESRRRRNLLGLVTTAMSVNPRLHVLAMSATPVVNNLFEARSLLELLDGAELEDLDVRPTTSNAMAIHQRLVRRGTRWMPDYPASAVTVATSIDCGDLVDDVRALGPHPHPAEIERVLLAAKLPSIIEACRRGKTLIYTEYVEGIVEELREALEAEGFRVGIFTGEDKTGLSKFIGDRVNAHEGVSTTPPDKHQIDVLIGSSAIGTGVDGLQHVCNSLVFATLPWTAAGYEQVVGRVHRQGQGASVVEIVIPITSAEVGEEAWSWCKTRLDRIHFKRSLADAAVDGIVPEYTIVDPHKAATAAVAWLARLMDGPAGMISAM